MNMRSLPFNILLVFLLFVSYSSVQSHPQLSFDLPNVKEMILSIFDELQSPGSTLGIGKVLEVLKKAQKLSLISQIHQGESVRKLNRKCKNNPNELQTFVFNKHVPSSVIVQTLHLNLDGIKSNVKLLNNVTAERKLYEVLKVSVEDCQKKWDRFINGRILKFFSTAKLLRKARRFLVEKSFLGRGKPAFLEILNRVKEEMDDFNDGLKPIIISLTDTMRGPSISKEEIQERLVRILKTIIKALHQKREELEEIQEGANGIFVALFKSFEENTETLNNLSIKINKEKEILLRRNETLKTQLYTEFRRALINKDKFTNRAKNCKVVHIKRKNLAFAYKKRRKILRTFEEVIKERFEALKSLFLQRKMRTSG